MKRRNFITSSLYAVAGSLILPGMIPVFKKNDTEIFCKLPAKLKHASQLVSNGLIGRLETVRIGCTGFGSSKELPDSRLFLAASMIMKSEPVSIETAVHSDFITKTTFNNGIILLTGSVYSYGIKYEGTDGWISVSPDCEVITGSENISQKANAGIDQNINSDILTGTKSLAGTIYLMNDIGIRLGRKLYWDAGVKQFIDDEEANLLLLKSHYLV